MGRDDGAVWASLTTPLPRTHDSGEGLDGQTRARGEGTAKQARMSSHGCAKRGVRALCGWCDGDSGDAHGTGEETVSA